MYDDERNDDWFASQDRFDGWDRGDDDNVRLEIQLENAKEKEVKKEDDKEDDGLPF